MSDQQARRRPRVLSPETKWEVFLKVTSGEMTQADAARKWKVDVSTVIGIRRTAKDAALAAFAASKPGRVRDPRDHEIEMLHGELARVTEAIKEQAIELSLVRGKSRWA